MRARPCTGDPWTEIPCTPLEWSQLRFALLAALVILPASFLFRADDPPAGEGLREAAYLIDLNNTEGEELALIPGIGPRLAEAVVSHRERHGPFRTIADLEKVSGLGPERVSLIAPWVFLTGRGGTPAPE